MSRLRLQLQLCLKKFTRLQLQLQLPYKIKNNRLQLPFLTIIIIDCIIELNFKKKLSRAKFKDKKRHKFILFSMKRPFLSKTAIFSKPCICIDNSITMNMINIKSRCFRNLNHV